MAGDGIDVAGSMKAHGAALSLAAGAALDNVAVLDKEAVQDAMGAPGTVGAHKVPDEVARRPEG